MGPNKPQYPPSIIIHEGSPGQAPQTRYGTPGPRVHGRQETARMGFPHIQQPAMGETGPVGYPAGTEDIQGPFSGPVMPFRKPDPAAPKPEGVSRETSRRIISDIFHPQEAEQPVVSSPAPAVEPEPQIQQAPPTLDSAYWQEWANYYSSFSVSPATYNDVEPHLIRMMDLPLAKLKQPIPANVALSISAFRQGGSPSFEAIAPQIETIRDFCFRICSRLAAITREEEDRVFLRSEQGQKVLAQYPDFARPYESAPNTLETAKKEYRRKLRKSLTLMAETAMRENPKSGQVFAAAKIGEFISDSAWELIQEAVTGLHLRPEQEAGIFRALPVSLRSVAFAGSGIFFGTDQGIPALPKENPASQNPDEPDEESPAYVVFRAKIARALLRAVVMHQAAFGDNNSNRQYLLYYTDAINPASVSSVNTPHPGFKLAFAQGNVTPDYNNFYKPVHANDKRFFGDLLTLMEHNPGAASIYWWMEEIMGLHQKNEGTLNSVAGLSTVLEAKNSACAILGGPETREETARAIHLNSLEESLETLNMLRARSARLIGQLMAELEFSQKKVQSQRELSYRATAETMAERNRADAAEEVNRQWRQSTIKTLQNLLELNGVFRWKRVADAIKAYLKNLGGTAQ